MKKLSLIFLICINYSVISFSAEVEYTIFNTENSDIGSNIVHDIIITDNGDIVFVHCKYDESNNVASRFDGNTWLTYTTNDIPIPDVVDISIDGENMWFASTVGLAHYDGHSWETFFEGYQFNTVAVDNNGSIWAYGKLSSIMHRPTLSKFNGSQWITYFIDGEMSSLAFSNENTAWAGTSSGVYWYDGVSWKGYVDEQQPFYKSIATDKNNVAWITGEINNGTNKYMIYSIDETGTINEYPYYGLDSIGYSYVAVDKNNTKWFLFDTNIIYTFNDTSWSEINLHDITGLYGWNSIAVDNEGTVWLGNRDSGVCKIDAEILINNAKPLTSPVKVITKPDYFHSAGKITTDSDYFPLEIGNTWIYKRKFSRERQSPGEHPTDTDYEDRVVLSIIDTLSSDNYLFLHGSVVNKDEQGNVNGLDLFIGALYLDFSPCGEVSCEDGAYIYGYPLWRTYRSEYTAYVPAGEFSCYDFHTCDGMHGISFSLAPDVGIVWWAPHIDIPMYEIFELEYACVNGVEYGVNVHVVEPGNSPSEFEIQCSYPNPFNPSTTINYSIAKLGNVTLEVYNILGQKVTTLFEGHKEAGTYSIRWDASEHANGIYIAVMKAGGITKTEKMMMVK